MFDIGAAGPIAGFIACMGVLIYGARERLANFKAPRHVLLVDALPLNATGKVQKDVLRARAIAELQGA